MNLTSHGLCPSPDNPVIVATEKVKSERTVLMLLTVGELGCAVGRAYVFGFLYGAAQLLSLWIDYIGYANLHYCHVMVISFLGAIEALMLFMNMRDGGPMQAAVFRSSRAQAVFWLLFLFAVVKSYSAFKVHKVFRSEY